MNILLSVQTEGPQHEAGSVWSVQFTEGLEFQLPVHALGLPGGGGRGGCVSSLCLLLCGVGCRFIS